MNRVTFAGLTALALLFCFSRSASAQAGDGRTCPGNTPTPNGANIFLRIFNDCPTSSLGFTNSYPASISMSEAMSGCSGFANLHTWSFSTDGGQNKATFENCSAYEFCATLVITGTGDAQGGLRISPWWAADASGMFYVQTSNGEIACTGGRLPFYSFTNAYGVAYTKGVTAFMKIIYTPHALSAAMPATIEYRLSLGGGPLLTSGPLPFGQGTPSEDPPHGLWGELVPAYAGGFFMPFVFSSPNLSLNCQWSNICYQALATVDVMNPAMVLDAGALRFEPTPFSGVGRAAFELAERSYVDLAVYDVAGRCVAVLAGQEFEAGPHESQWDGRDMRGQDVVTGVYLLRLRTRGVRTHQTTTRTVTAVRVR